MSRRDADGMSKCIRLRYHHCGEVVVRRMETAASVDISRPRDSAQAWHLTHVLSQLVGMCILLFAEGSFEVGLCHFVRRPSQRQSPPGTRTRSRGGKRAGQPYQQMAVLGMVLMMRGLQPLMKPLHPY